MTKELLRHYTFSIDAFFHQNQSILEKQTLTIEAAKWTCLIGPSGVGKTTLLRCIAGLQGKEQNNNIGYMSQNDTLLPWLSAIDNTVLGQRLRKEKRNYDKALHILTELGLKNFAGFYPHQLSLGMRQRVVLARALIENNEIILMDEPFAALDAKTRQDVQNYAIKALKGKTVVLVTHDIGEVMRMADHVYLLKGSPAKATPIDLKEILGNLPTPRVTDCPHVWQKASSLLSSLYA